LMRDAVHGEGVEPDFFFHGKGTLNALSRGKGCSATRDDRRLSAGLSERQFGIRRWRQACDVERHREHVVIPVHRDQVHDARFAEFFQRPGRSGISIANQSFRNISATAGDIGANSSYRPNTDERFALTDAARKH
jgi:hypothetical protein